MLFNTAPTFTLTSVAIFLCMQIVCCFLAHQISKETEDDKRARLASLDPNDHPIGWKPPGEPPRSFKEEVREILDHEDRRSVERLAITFYRCPKCKSRGSNLTLEDIRTPCTHCDGYVGFRLPNDQRSKINE